MTVPSTLPLEPSPLRLRNPLLRYALATRPAFLTITLAGCLLGLATAWHDSVRFNAGLAWATLLLALLAHAGVNVLNDFFDHLNGTDAINTERLFPFTGGSRFIQNGVLTPRQTGWFGSALFAVVVVGGLWLMTVAGQGLFWIGLGGLFIGWAYSAPPLKLNSRGWGEACVALGFLLVVVGADTVQRGAVAGLPWLVGLPYALLTTNILFINQFPDRAADFEAGKHHWVVRLSPQHATVVYGLIVLVAATALVGMVVLEVLPMWSVLSLTGLLPAAAAWHGLQRHCTQPRQLVPAIKATILAAHLHAVMLAGSLLWARGV